MSITRILDALKLPDQAAVGQRVPKKTLAEQGAPTAADKRQINDGIEELVWVAALKPTTIGVPEFRDAAHEYLEIAVLSLSLRPDANATRLVELIHRSIPYPVMLAAEQAGTALVSMVHKRLAQNEAGRMVLEGDVTSAVIADGANPSLAPATEQFLGEMALANQPRTDMLALYHRWIERVEALQAAQITGRYVSVNDPSVVAARRNALAAQERLQREMEQLRAQAEKETQMNRRVDLNLAIKRLEAELAAALKNL